MATLILDTATERGAVAILGKERWSQDLPIGLRNSTYILPTIREGLEALKLKPKQVMRVIFGVGPGSYTGIRVAAAVAKSYAYSCSIPTQGVSTLKGFIPDKDGTFAAVVDAKISGLFYLKGKRSLGVISWEGEPQICASLDVLKEVSILVTPHQEMIQKKFGVGEWLWQERAPDLFHMADCAVDDTSLIYLRAVHYTQTSSK